MKKKINFLIVTFLFAACGPIYRLSHKKQTRASDEGLKQLTAFVNANNRAAFMAALRVDSDYVSFDKNDTLGFGYFKRERRLYTGNQNSFETYAIIFNDSILSISVTPSYANVNRHLYKHYRHTLQKLGWEYNFDGYFKSKYFDFETSTKPIPDKGLTYKPVKNSHLDSLMSPFYQVETSDYLGKMSIDELHYLSHSISPHRRVGVMKRIKCDSLIANEAFNSWLSEVKKSTPFMLAGAMLNGRAVFFGYQPLDYFLNCEIK